MKRLLHKHTISFSNAFNGVRWAVKTQPNFSVHLFLSALAILAGFFFGISYFEWLIVIALIFLGLTIEMKNTSIEATLDAVDRTIREDIKIAKDVSAAAMLLFACGALVIALFIFLPKI